MLVLRRRLLHGLGAEALPGSFWLLWSGAFLNRLGNFVVPFLAIYLTEQRGLGAERVGLMLSLYGVGGVGAAVVGGQLADRVGRRTTMVAALVLSASAMLQLATARGEAHLMLSVLGLGFFGELYRPAMQAMVADLVPEGAPRAAAFGALYWAANAGFALSTVVAGAMARRSFASLFVADAVTTLSFAVLTLWGLPETLPAREPGTNRERLSLAGLRRGLRASVRSALSPLGDPALVTLLAGQMLLMMVVFQTSSTLPVAMRERGIDARTFGLLLSINGVLIVVLQPVLTRWLATWPRRTTLAGGALLTGVGYASHALAHAPLAWALGIVLWTLGEIVVAPRISALVADLAPAARRGSYQGMLSVSYGLAAFAGPLAGGWLLARGGSLVWVACGLAGVLAATLMSRRPGGRDGLALKEAG